MIVLTPPRLIPFSVRWPARELSPNARVHWSVRARRVKSARGEAAYNAWAMGWKKLAASKLKLTVTFYPPDKRKRDLGNLIGSIKAHIDGIQDTTGIDDHFFDIEYKFGPVDPPGRVLFEGIAEEAA